MLKSVTWTIMLENLHQMSFFLFGLTPIGLDRVKVNFNINISRKRTLVCYHVIKVENEAMLF